MIANRFFASYLEYEKHFKEKKDFRSNLLSSSSSSVLIALLVNQCLSRLYMNVVYLYLKSSEKILDNTKQNTG
ncbi:hypothetical protein DERP_011366 [Dermatophagoides pteronyssinus]|uniref:Uncharacterized protein n=1 Tax=Dermatophagoides pteronyssinus TaxID=6956 RepID=A0ABQ8J7D3_DERPT|nr:hypothetical protein DERP_011366 [Dermatophagoides pteronyssinus]